jgi:RNA polymerase sigma-70 factor (ECF subfamily)
MSRSLVTLPVRHQVEATTQENRLVRQAQNGSLEAFNELVLRHQDRVFRQALWILNDDAAAEDATQEAFLQAYRKLDTFRDGPFLPWLLRITTNYCLDQLRYAKRRPTQSFEQYDEDGEEIEPKWACDPIDSPEQAVENSEVADEIIASVQRLSWRYRIPIILVDLQDLGYEEASAVMRIPIGTFKSRLCRARQKLCVDLQKNSLFGMRSVCA